MKNRVNRIFLFILIVLAFMPFIDRLEKFFWFFDNFAHFRLHYIYLVFIIIFLLIIFKRFFLLPVAFIALFVNITALGSFHSNSYKIDKNLLIEEKRRIFFYNINWEKDNPDNTVLYVKKITPDIIILVELSPYTYFIYKEKFVDYKYSKYTPNLNPDEPFNGLAIYSRIEPIDEIKVINFGKWTCPSLQINIMLNNKKLSIIGTHPYSPINKRRTLSRNTQLQLLADYIRENNFPVILIGDFNSTQWQKGFKYLLKQAKLIDPTKFFGLQPTWPTFLPSFFRLQIDHVLHTKEIIILNKFTSDKLDSDHLGLIVDFTI